MNTYRIWLRSSEGRKERKEWARFRRKHPETWDRNYCLVEAIELESFVNEIPSLFDTFPSLIARFQERQHKSQIRKVKNWIVPTRHYA